MPYEMQEDVWELDDRELDVVRGGQSAPSWECLWIASEELLTGSDALQGPEGK